MNTPHKHAELIKKWADGAEIEVYLPDSRWARTAMPLWEVTSLYRVKPEVTTSLDNAVLRKTYYDTFGLPDCTYVAQQATMNTALRAVADAAIKQYIKDSANKA